MIDSVDKSLKIHVLDVGHGDSIVIEFPEKQSYGIIDCTYRGKSKYAKKIRPSSKEEPDVVTFLKERFNINGKFDIEFVCLTHPHYDHYKGLSRVLEWLKEKSIKVKQIWDFGLAVNKIIALKKIAEVIESAGSRAEELCRFYKLVDEFITELHSDYRMVKGYQKSFWKKGGVKIDALAPNDYHIVTYGSLLAFSESEKRAYVKKTGCSWATDDNIASSVFLLRYGKCRILLGGDAPNDTWQYILNDDSLKTTLSCKAVKVSHHGSINGSFPFLRNEKANEDTPIWEYFNSGENNTEAIISGGYRNLLPHPKTINSLDTMKIPWYCTGSVVIDESSTYLPEIDDDSVKFYFEKLNIIEVEDKDEKGDGDITINCLKSGDVKVETEITRF